MESTRRKAWTRIAQAAACAWLLAFGAPAIAASTSDATLTGTLRVAVADDFVHQRAQTLYHLETDDGRRLVVDFADASPGPLRSGLRVRLHGDLDGTRLRVDRSAAAVEVLAVPQATTETLPAPQKRKVLVLLTDMRDSTATTHALDPTCDGVTDATAAIMFGGTSGAEHVDGVYLDSSFGLEGIGGGAYPGTASDVVRVLIDLAVPFGTSCDAYAWAESADAAAVAAGVNLGNFQHRVYVLPPNMGCSWGGLGEVGCGTNCRAWEATYSFNLCGTRGAHAHELGHNRGLLHASTDGNNDGAVDAEYGDYSNFMGSNFDELQQVNAPHKLAMGWIDAANVVDATGGGTFTVSALELANAPFPQVLKLQPASGYPVYVSYRAAIGYDATMPYGANYLGRTSLHRWAGGYENTLFLKALGDNESFGDAGLGLKVRQVAHDEQTSTVEITQVTPPVLTMSAPPITEGQSGSKQQQVLFQLSTPAPWPVVVHVQTFDGTATGGSDYQAINMASFEIEAGTSMVAFPIDIYGDTAKEGNETFELILTGVTGATYPASNLVLTIIDDEAQLSVSDANIVEGNAGTKQLTFTVTLSEAVDGYVGFFASTANGTATAGTDYVARNNVQLSIAPGQLSRTFSITINGDTTVEPTETLLLNLTTVTGAMPVDMQGVGYLINDDGALLTVKDVAIGEGNAGTKVMTFTVSLSQVAPGPVSYSFSTVDSSATAGSDYASVNLAGQTIPQGQLSKTHSVTINGDTTLEDTEVFFVNVRQPVGASVWDGQGIGYLLNDDGPTLSVPDASVAEGNAGTKVMTITVLLSQAAAVPVTYSLATANVSATASDYTALNLVDQVIPAGQTSKTHQVIVNGDTAVEPNESFTVTLANPTGATLYDRQAIATIYNDDGPTLSVNDVAINEGNSGTKVATFTVTLSQAAAVGIAYDIATSNLTATSGSDYIANALVGQQIPAGQLSKTFTVTLNGDTAVEANETFRVTLSNISAGATLFKYTGTGTITNDD